MKTVVVALILAASAAGQKKPALVSKTYPNTRTFQTSCDNVWPVALQVFTSDGWGIRTSDRAGGILTLEWTRGEVTGSYRKINPMIEQYAVKKATSFWTREYYGFRMVSAQAVAIPHGDSCLYTVTAIYQGLEAHIGGGRSWEVLPSNGFFEDKMLGEIQKNLPLLKAE